MADQPSLFSRTSYRLSRMMTPLVSNLNDVDWSENSSRTSLNSVSSTSTAATSITDEHEYETVEDIFVAKADTLTPYAFTTAHKVFHRDLHNNLNEVLPGHVYLSRLRLVGKDLYSFRPSVLIMTKSAKTKLAFAHYLRKGPPIMKRLSTSGLDIHLVLDSFGLAGCPDDVHSPASAAAVQANRQSYSSQAVSSSYMTVKDDRNNNSITFVAGMKLRLGDELVLASVYHPLAALDPEQQSWQEASSNAVSKAELEDYCGAMSIYFDDVYNEDRSIKVHGASSKIHDPSQPQNVLDLMHEYGLRSTGQEDKSGMTSPIANKPGNLRNCAVFTVAPTARGKLSSDKLKVAGPADQDQSDPSTHVDDCPLEADLQAYGEGADWSVWKVHLRGKEQQLSFQQPNEVDGHIVDQFLPDDVESQLDVTLQLPDQILSARLQLDTVFYQIGSQQLELKVVSLDQPLQRGCSGAVVTHKNQAVGMVIAVEDHRSEAYIMTFDMIIKDVERVTGKIVRLPLPVETTSPSDLLPSLLPKAELSAAIGTELCSDEVWGAVGIKLEDSSQKALSTLTVHGGENVNALHHATKRAHEDVAELLLMRKTDVDIQSCPNDTANTGCNVVETQPGFEESPLEGGRLQPEVSARSLRIPVHDVKSKNVRLEGGSVRGREHIVTHDSRSVFVPSHPTEVKNHLSRGSKKFECDRFDCPRKKDGFATRNDLERHRLSVHVIRGHSLRRAPNPKKMTKPQARPDNVEDDLMLMYRAVFLCLDDNLEAQNLTVSNEGSLWTVGSAPIVYCLVFCSILQGWHDGCIRHTEGSPTTLLMSVICAILPLLVIDCWIENIDTLSLYPVSSVDLSDSLNWFAPLSYFKKVRSFFSTLLSRPAQNRSRSLPPQILAVMFLIEEMERILPYCDRLPSQSVTIPSTHDQLLLALSRLRLDPPENLVFGGFEGQLARYRCGWPILMQRVVNLLANPIDEFQRLLWMVMSNTQCQYQREFFNAAALVSPLVEDQIAALEASKTPRMLILFIRDRMDSRMYTNVLHQNQSTLSHEICHSKHEIIHMLIKRELGAKAQGLFLWTSFHLNSTIERDNDICMNPSIDENRRHAQSVSRYIEGNERSKEAVGSERRHDSTLRSKWKGFKSSFRNRMTALIPAPVNRRKGSRAT